MITGHQWELLYRAKCITEIPQHKSPKQICLVLGKIWGVGIIFTHNMTTRASAAFYFCTADALLISVVYFASSSAIAESCARFSSVSAERIVTVVSVKVVFLQPSSIPRISFAAAGAHVPFSIRPI